MRLSLRALLCKAAREGLGEPYIRDVLARAESIDEAGGTYTISREAFDELRSRWRRMAPAGIEASLHASGYQPRRDATAGGCDCDPPLE